MGRKYVGKSLCDSSCRGCIYFGIFLRCCEYMIQTGRNRPCPAGKGCTVRTTKRGRTMAQAIDADAFSYLARKEKEDRLSAELRQSDLEGMSYGQWKSGQPVVEMPRLEPSEEPEKVCQWCGKPIAGMRKGAKYCRKECRDSAYNLYHREQLLAKNRRYRERKKLEAEGKEQGA